MQRVARLVEEAPVVGQPALRPRDEVDDGGRVGGDHARPRRLLRAIVEVGADVRVAGQVEAEVAQRGEAHLDPALLRIRVGERGQPADVGRVKGRRRRRSVRSQQAVEPAIAQLDVGVLDQCAALGDHIGQLAQRDALVFLAAENGILDSGQLRLHGLRRTTDLEPPLVHRRRGVGVDLAQLLAICVFVEHRELRVGVPQRHALSAVVDADRQQLVLYLVLHVDEIAREQAPLAALPESVEPLVLGVVALRVLGGLSARRADPA